jgi:hypothetical protein
MYGLGNMFFRLDYPLNTASYEAGSVTLITYKFQECAVFIVQGAPPSRYKTRYEQATPALKDKKLVLADQTYDILWEAPTQNWPAPADINTAILKHLSGQEQKQLGMHERAVGGAEIGFSTLVEDISLDASARQLIEARQAMVVVYVPEKGTYLIPIKLAR